MVVLSFTTTPGVIGLSALSCPLGSVLRFGIHR